MRNAGTIDRSSPLPLFYQVAERLKDRLGAGRYQAGDRFLTVREVVGEYGVSFVTAQRALARLAQENLVTSERGRGTVVNRSARKTGRRAPRRQARTRRVLVLRPTHWPVAPSFQSNLSAILDGLQASLPGHSIAMEFPDESLLQAGQDAYLQDLLESSGYAGFCLLSSPVHVKKFFQEHSVPVVVLGNIEPGINLSYVSSSEQRGNYDLTTHLIRKGHRRIAQVIGTPRVAGHEDRLSGFRRALADAGLAAEEGRAALESAVPYDRDRTLAHVHHLMASAAPPTAIICTGSLMASWLHSAFAPNLHVAYDVNSEAQEPMLPGSTVLVWPGYQFGYTAGRILLDQTDGRLDIQRRALDYVCIRDC